MLHDWNAAAALGIVQRCRDHLEPRGGAVTARIGIVGAGPVGMALALLLDRHGVATVLFDADPAARRCPRGSTQGARTMETYRRLGLSSQLRRLGLPPDYAADVRYVTRLDGHELARIAMPCERDKQRAVAASGELDQVPEPVLRANQMYVEQFVMNHIATRPNITYRPDWRVEQFAQDAAGVTVHASHEHKGSEPWTFDYLVGCDGARSMVRRQLGIELGGSDGIAGKYFGGGMLATQFRAPALHDTCLRDRPAFQYWITNPEIRATIVALDGRGEFLLFTRPPADDAPATPEWLLHTIERCIGHATTVEPSTTRPWRAGVALVAERFFDHRVFLCGDAAHLFTPTGGFGMNTGIEDAANLAWKLAANVQGWATTGLLATYEAERRPIALRNVAAARQLSRRVGEVPISPDLESESAAGVAAREALAPVLAGFADEFDSLGVHLGARYDGSSIVIGDGDPPADRHDRYEPSGVPGGRAPHFWVNAGRGIGSSIYDRLGIGFTLLRFDPEGGSCPEIGQALVTAARALSVPLTVLDIASRGAQALYGAPLAIIRPDAHLAWRGDEPVDARTARSILRRVTASPVDDDGAEQGG